MLNILLEMHYTNEQEVAESLSEIDFQKNLEALQQSQVWKKHQRLRAYVEHQWLADEKFKVCCHV